MDLLTVTEIAAMLKTSEGIALQVMGDTPYLHLGSGNGKGRRYRRAVFGPTTCATSLPPRPSGPGRT